MYFATRTVHVRGTAWCSLVTRGSVMGGGVGGGVSSMVNCYNNSYQYDCSK